MFPIKKSNKKFIDSISIKTITLLMFVVSLCVTVGAIGFITYTNWSSSNNQVINRLAVNLNKEIVHRVKDYLLVPESIIQLNLGLIENEGVEFDDPIARNRFFLNTLNNQEETIYSFSYGSNEGEYYGARRNEIGEVELMYNNNETGGNSWYYTLGVDGALGEFIRNFGTFDPRTRAWYERAISAEGFSYSPIYKHFVMNDLTISAASPIRVDSGDIRGVLGIHILLSGLNRVLSEITESENTYAIIVERETGHVIANSLGQENYKLDDEGKFKRITINESGNDVANKTYDEYISGKTDLIEGYRDEEKLYSMATEFDMPGIEWIVITAVSESLLGTNVNDVIMDSLIVVLMGLLISILVFVFISRKLFYPIEKILEANEIFSKGDLTKRVIINRDDELGRISNSYNRMAERIYSLVNNLESEVKARTEEIIETNYELKESKDRLELILDSAAEGIYGVDLDGICTFVNDSALKILGYDSHDELLGKNIHDLIHHSSTEGFLIDVKECLILDSINKGKGNHVNNEVFWRKDKTFFPVEYFSYPQKLEGETVGGVVTFMDITERKNLEHKVYSEKEQFRTTLLSVGDGVISTDSKGRIKLMNPVAESLTGWTQSEAQGLPLENVFNRINEYTGETCESPVERVLGNMEVIELANNTLLVSKDGRRIPIEDSAAPIRNEVGITTGIVVVFRDFTEKKEKLNEIKYLSYHDHLTGLYNRRYIEDSLTRLDTQRNFPFTIMSVDVNGLKLTNDTFGHEMGDKILISCGKILREVCREDDIIGRMGGDEFMILLPSTDEVVAQKIKERIEIASKKIRLDSVIVSLAVGFSTKDTEDIEIQTVMSKADNNMYKNKLKYGKIMRSQTIELLLKNINLKYDNEQIHTERVSQYCEAIAREIGFSENEVNKVKTAAVLHDIGKITISTEILNKPGRLTQDEYEIIKKHPETGYQILKSVDEYAPFALDILYHHERIDGNGYPEGLKGEEIPLVARIIAVADTYEAMMAKRPYQIPKTKDEAIQELIRCSGSQFDPEIVRVFVEHVL